MTKNALLIYNQLTASGLTHAGALGLMGNWMAESGLEANRMQGDFNTDRLLSKAYTDDIMKGRISRAQFTQDQKGYGLAQWTYYSRKGDLYDYWKETGTSLDDVRMQVKFALHELSTQGQYAGLWSLLKTGDNLWTAVDKVCRLYERPYYNNVEARYRFAVELEEELKHVGTVPTTEEPHFTLPKEPSEAGLSGQGGAAKGGSFPDASGKRDNPKLATTFWPPRTIDRNMTGPDVAALQGLLHARGLYGKIIDGYFGDELDKAVRSFQAAHGLTIDGIVGPMTWGELLKR